MNYRKKNHILKSNILLEQRFLGTGEDKKFDRLGIALTSDNDNQFVNRMSEYDKMTRGESLTPEELKILHKILDNVAYYAGWIPIPIFQVVSIGADLVNAGVYFAEGKFREGGLSIALAASTGVVDIIVRKFNLDKLWIPYLVKQINRKLNKKIKLNPYEVDLLKEVIDNKNKLYKSLDDLAKENAERYLKNPKQYKEAYNFKFKKDLAKFEWGSPEAIKFYRDMAKSGVRAVTNIGVQGGLDVGLGLATLGAYNYIVGTPLRDQIDDESYKNLMSYFGGDVNNKDDESKLDKAFNDGRITHTIINIEGISETKKGFRPESEQFPGFYNYSEVGYPNLFEYINEGNKYLPCDLIPSQLALDLNHPCVKNKYYKVITKLDLESEGINLPYVYKKLGNDYYYADPKKTTEFGLKWKKITDSKNKNYLEKEIFPKFK